MEASASTAPLQIRKYSNRRLYDSTHSRHITADDLYQLVRDGHDVVVTDSASGADITHQVLTQMILERDSPKLEVFPTTLLHEIIRANQQMWRRFVEQWLNGLTAAITQQADAYARRVAEFGRRSLDASALGKMLAGALRPGEPSPAEEASAEPTTDELRKAVRELQHEVERLGRQVATGAANKRRRHRA
ncbi:MAG TPA: polyhydroxyalkanoate synthesis regulator DNA-binding domain-containing protein [Candidatus Binatia bacterium]|nr:polyhydroxyalkanoate synthesis regulator DNA-binding domain-containing protein [Candidatus Binatia bacterium]